MDTSEQYIKMRLAAISDLGEGDYPLSVVGRASGDFEVGHDVFVDRFGNFYYFSEGTVPNSGKYCQLERQDQLQEMVGGYSFHIWTGRDGLVMTASTGNRDSHMIGNNFVTMEQLGLAFVMKENYNKVWTGEGWVIA